MTEEFTLCNDIKPTNKPPRFHSLKIMSEQVALVERIENSYTLKEIAEMDGTSIENVKLFLEEDHDLPFFKVDGEYYFDKHTHDAWVKQKNEELFDKMIEIQDKRYKDLGKIINPDENLVKAVRFINKLNKMWKDGVDEQYEIFLKEQRENDKD